MGLMLSLFFGGQAFPFLDNRATELFSGSFVSCSTSDS
jgi:hypothetical protein